MSATLGTSVLNVATSRAGVTVHLREWSTLRISENPFDDDFVKIEGDPNYQAIRRDGSRWRGVRGHAWKRMTAGWKKLRKRIPPLMLARLVDARRLARRPDEHAGKEIGQRRMVLPVRDEAPKEIGAA